MVDNSTRHNETNSPAKKPPEPHQGIEWSNWALVLVGIGGVYAALEAGRKTGIFRTLNIETMHFVASKDPEDEYQD